MINALGRLPDRNPYMDPSRPLLPSGGPIVAAQNSSNAALPNMKLKPLPFFEVIGDPLMKPTFLCEPTFVSYYHSFDCFLELGVESFARDFSFRSNGTRS